MGFDRRLGRRCRAAEVGVESDPAPSSGASDCRCRREADRVTGARYPSRASDLSESEGDGEMTRGVAGTVPGESGISKGRTANGGSAEDHTRPTSGLVQISALSRARLPRNIGGAPKDSMMGDRVLNIDERIGYRLSASPDMNRKSGRSCKTHGPLSSHVD